VDRSSAEGTLVEAPKTPKTRGGTGRGCLPPRRIPRNFFYCLTSKWCIFGAVFKLDLTEETRTQLQQEGLS